MVQTHCQSSDMLRDWGHFIQGQTEPAPQQPRQTWLLHTDCLRLTSLCVRMNYKSSYDSEFLLLCPPSSCSVPLPQALGPSSWFPLGSLTGSARGALWATASLHARVLPLSTARTTGPRGATLCWSQAELERKARPRALIVAANTFMA